MADTTAVTKRERRLEQKRAYYQRNRAKIALYNAKYRAAHLEEAKIYQRSIPDTPERREARRKSALKYYYSHKEQCYKSAREWTKKHPEAQRRWNKAHPEHRRAMQKRRRAVKYGALADFTQEQWDEMQAAYKFRCVYCHKKPAKLTQDHIIPLRNGGQHTLSNIVPACHACNSKKGIRPPLIPVQPLLITEAKSKNGHNKTI